MTVTADVLDQDPDPRSVRETSPTRTYWFSLRHGLCLSITCWAFHLFVGS